MAPIKVFEISEVLLKKKKEQDIINLNLDAASDYLLNCTSELIAAYSHLIRLKTKKEVESSFNVEETSLEVIDLHEKTKKIWGKIDMFRQSKSLELRDGNE